jgi:hypothetical protein
MKDGMVFPAEESESDNPETWRRKDGADGAVGTKPGGEDGKRKRRKRRKVRFWCFRCSGEGNEDGENGEDGEGDAKASLWKYIKEQQQLFVHFSKTNWNKQGFM